MLEKNPIIGILTDFGERGLHYVSQMKAIAKKINPRADIIDISHSITQYSIIEASFIIFSTYRHFPKNTVFACAVDPHLGYSEEIIIIESRDGYKFVGPNNGIFTYFAIYNNISLIYSASDIDFFYEPFKDSIIQKRDHEKYKQKLDEVLDSALMEQSFNKSGSEETVIAENSKIKNEAIDMKIKSTARWRDIIIPVTAHLSNGLDIFALGTPLDDINILDNISPDIKIDEKRVIARIQYIDTFGNLITTINNIAFQSLTFVQGHHIILMHNKIRYNLHINRDVIDDSSDILFFIPGDGGFMEILMNQKNTHQYLGIGVGDTIEILIEDSQSL